jgi:hypothetical protein
MTKPFETFEITGVPDHTGILLHPGNYDGDSSGCVLLGQNIITQPNGIQMITNSHHAFEDVMNSLVGITEFQLTVNNDLKIIKTW